MQRSERHLGDYVRFGRINTQAWVAELFGRTPQVVVHPGANVTVNQHQLTARAIAAHISAGIFGGERRKTTIHIGRDGDLLAQSHPERKFHGGFRPLRWLHDRVVSPQHVETVTSSQVAEDSVEDLGVNNRVDTSRRLRRTWKWFPYHLLGPKRNTINLDIHGNASQSDVNLALDNQLKSMGHQLMHLKAWRWGAATVLGFAFGAGIRAFKGKEIIEFARALPVPDITFQTPIGEYNVLLSLAVAVGVFAALSLIKTVLAPAHHKNIHNRARHYDTFVSMQRKPALELS